MKKHILIKSGVWNAIKRKLGLSDEPKTPTWVHKSLDRPEIKKMHEEFRKTGKGPVAIM